MNPKILIGVVCLCVANGAFAQNYYQEYQTDGQQQQQQQQHRPAPARLSPSNGPVTEKPQPVAILKQINRHNEDGSYTYGFEGADGSFKIETKAQTGEVKGKYGYVDETGKVRVVEYGADKYGFQPSGEGITVAPPTLVDESRQKDADYQDEEERQPQRPYTARFPQQQQQQQPRPRPAPQRIQPQYEEYQQQQQQQAPQHTTYELRPQQQQQSLRRQQLIQAQAPQRAVVSGAVPSDVTYSAQQREPRPDYNQNRGNFGQIASQQQQQRYDQANQLSRGYETQENVAPQQFNYAPAPAPQRAPVAAPAQLPQNNYPQGRSSVLDQLAKDYALPNNGAAALTDVSFGFY